MGKDWIFGFNVPTSEWNNNDLLYGIQPFTLITQSITWNCMYLFYSWMFHINQSLEEEGIITVKSAGRWWCQMPKQKNSYLILSHCSIVLTLQFLTNVISIIYTPLVPVPASIGLTCHLLYGIHKKAWPHNMHRTKSGKLKWPTWMMTFDLLAFKWCIK